MKTAAVEAFNLLKTLLSANLDYPLAKLSTKLLYVNEETTRIRDQLELQNIKLLKER